MIYAHDQTVADDYFAAMQRVEQRLEIMPASKEEVTAVPQPDQVSVWIERLALPELCNMKRIEIAKQLKQTLALAFNSQLSPPVVAS